LLEDNHPTLTWEDIEAMIFELPHEASDAQYDEFLEWAFQTLLDRVPDEFTVDVLDGDREDIDHCVMKILKDYHKKHGMKSVRMILKNPPFRII
jgi:hypothetical protein